MFPKIQPSAASLQRHPSVGNVLARASSFGTGPFSRQTSNSSNESESSTVSRQFSLGTSGQKQANEGVQRQGSNVTGNGVLRQGSQGSLFEQIANQAKDLVRETTRQSSQDGILAQMDKVFLQFWILWLFENYKTYKCNIKCEKILLYIYIITMILRIVKMFILKFLDF